eukprot:Unigene15755_Nuclearia_a/m.46951 Unigene15755_Nuclearia_a/g.46951  ORF Unigene15755_Nuclearia_a/g.46951 Unigene15755_Nuclearia_a/m.46951 type:complete len:370 (-) Unigene15755_Nuclearia_a:455-1564(-)
MHGGEMGIIGSDIDQAGVRGTQHGHTGHCACCNKRCYCFFHVWFSKPQANTGHETRFIHITTLVADEIGGFAVGAVPGDADVGGELADNFIAQAQPDFGIGQAGAHAAPRVVLAIEIGFSGWLQDQAVGQQNVVVAFQARGSLAVLTNERSGFGLEVVKCHALDTERRPGLGRFRLEILAHPGNHIPPWADRAAVQQLQFGILGDTVGAFTFGADPQTVDIAAYPARSIPGQRAAFIGILVLELIQQEEAVDRTVVHLMPAQRREGRLAVGIGQHRDRGTAGRRRIRRAVVHFRMVHRSMVHGSMVHSPMIHGAVVHALHAAMIHLAVVHRRMVHFFSGEAGRSPQHAERNGQCQQRWSCQAIEHLSLP